MELKPGTKIKLENGIAVVQDLLGDGGQGSVYTAKYGDEKVALKIYKESFLCGLKDKNAFLTNLKRNAEKGSPTKDEIFLWPRDVIIGKAINGYIMNICPHGYYEFSRFLLDKRNGGVRFTSFKTATMAMLKILEAFRILHAAGYSYQDLNDGNFMINPDNGGVLVCDNDNVAPNGRNSGIVGKPRYIAPEVVMEKNLPNTASDRHSLAVILFLMLTNTHPLEGKRFLTPLLSANLEKKLYGEEPVFIMSEEDSRNGPIEGIHSNIIFMWKILPEYIKNTFKRAFSKEVLSNPSFRVTESEWQDQIMRLYSDFIICPFCEKEQIYTGKDNITCLDCGKSIPPLRRMQLQNKSLNIPYDIPVSYDSRIFQGQTKICNIYDSNNPVAMIKRSKNNHTAYYFTNTSSSNMLIKCENMEETLEPKKSKLISTEMIIRHPNGNVIIK